MLNRRTLLVAGAAAVGAGVLSCASTSTSPSPWPSPSPSLPFDPAAFSELTTTIETDGGPRAVTYRFFRAIPYVSRPTAPSYQCLNISVPVSIDGKRIDSSTAPILFANSVGGYMPSSVAEATGVGEARMMGPPPGMPPRGMGPLDAPAGSNLMLNAGRRVNLPQLALAAGFVVVEPGARGRTLVGDDGVYFGTAPAAIVDLKAAVRFLRHHRGRIPGNVEHIVSSGTSAGGALSALLAASADSPLYAEHLRALGAADESDAIFACGAWCPITDLEHADMAYEWNWGANPLASGAAVDGAVSRALSSSFTAYQASLQLVAGGAPLTADRCAQHLLTAYVQPAASRFLAALNDAERTTYLKTHPRVSWDGTQTRVDWAAFLEHVGARKKNVPAFDAFDLSSGENNLFGRGTTKARHFTAFSQQHASPGSALDDDIAAVVRLMNPMGFIAVALPQQPRRWWLRVGTKDTDTSLTVVSNLAAALSQRGHDVDARMYWDAGHGANEDAGAFLAWAARA